MSSLNCAKFFIVYFITSRIASPSSLWYHTLVCLTPRRGGSSCSTHNEAALIGGLISTISSSGCIRRTEGFLTRVLEHLRTGRVSAADLKQVQKALAFLTPTCRMSREAQRDLMGASLKTTALLSSCR